MPLKFERVDVTSRKEFLRVRYQDEFGQPRFFEFDGISFLVDDCVGPVTFGQELIQQVNELLARPRPADGTVKRGGLTFNCKLRPSSVGDEIAIKAVRDCHGLSERNRQIREQMVEPFGFDGGVTS